MSVCQSSFFFRIQLEIDWDSNPRLTGREHDGGELTLVFTFYTPLETVCWFTEYVLVHLCMNELESWDQAVFSLWFLYISSILLVQ
jgi:hypothetical protein